MCSKYNASQNLKVDKENSQQSAMQQPQLPAEVKPAEEEPVKRYKSLLHLFLICINLGLGTFYAGNGLASLSSVEFDTIIEIYGITWPRSLAQGLLTGAMPIGASFGAIATPHLFELFSRRNCLLVVNAFALIVGALVYIENDIVFLIVRLLNGFIVGLLSSIVPVVIKEIAPVEASGTLGAMVQFFVAFGIFFTFLFRFIVASIETNGDEIFVWKIVASLTLWTVTIQSLILIFIFPYETPKYLLANGKQEEAKELLRMIYFEEYVEEVYHEKQLDLGTEFIINQGRKKKKQQKQKKEEEMQNRANNKVAPNFEINLNVSDANLVSNGNANQPQHNEQAGEQQQDNEQAAGESPKKPKAGKLPPIKQAQKGQENQPQTPNLQVEQKPSETGSEAERIQKRNNALIQENRLEKKDSNLAIFIALHLTFLKQLTGLNGVVAYGGQITKEAIPEIKDFFSVLLNFEQVLGALVVTFLLTRVGRKTILQVGTFINICMCFAVAVGFFIRPDHETAGTTLIIIGLFVYMANLTTTLAPVVWIFAAELVQPWVAPYAILFNWLGAAFVMFFFPIVTSILPDENPAGLFVFFGLYSLVAFIFDHFYVIETMDKTEKVIREEYKQKKFCC